MPDPKVDDPVVEVEQETPAKEAPGVEIDLNAKAPVEPSVEDRIAAKVKADLEALHRGRIQQLEDRLRGSYRINEKLQRQLAEVQQRPAPVAPAPAPKNVWDTIENGETWQQEIGRIAAEKAESIYQQRIALEQQQREYQTQQSTLDASKAEVIKLHPELDPDTGDPESPFAKAFEAELNADARLLRNEYGPIIAAQRAEARLTGHATTVRQSEDVRRQRVTPGALPASRSGLRSDKVLVSRDQKEFIDYHGIDPKVYAQMQQALENGEGVTL